MKIGSNLYPKRLEKREYKIYYRNKLERSKEFSGITVSLSFLIIWGSNIYINKNIWSNDNYLCNILLVL